MLSFAVYLAELLVILSHVPCPGFAFRSVRDTCPSTSGVLPNLDLGLPPNSTVFVSGYLPKPGNWYCNTGHSSYQNVHGAFWSYYSHGTNVAIGVSSNNSPNDLALYAFHSNNGGQFYLRICKWSRPGLNWATSQTSGACVVNRKFRFVFAHAQSQVIGLTWSSNVVTFYGVRNVYRYYVHNNWDRVDVRCELAPTCAINPVNSTTTFNVTTNAQGLISSYSVCDVCDGFPLHIFPVLEGGYIPSDFRMDNWYVLSNTSTILDGRVVMQQPLLVSCLWPVPSLLVNDDPIYFNMSLNNGVKCNGYSQTKDVSHLRFALNFTEQQVLNGVHNINFRGESFNFTFTCTNDTDITRGERMVPFGFIDTVYRCFVYFDTTNGTVNKFVGILPPIVKEIVVSRYGTVYINGVNMLTLPPIDSVVFNVTSNVGADFWTVAFVDMAEVMMDINATQIANILYCDTPVNKLKCQQLTYSLDDGFYTTTNVYTREVPRTYVALPYHATHSVINITAYFTSDMRDDQYFINGVNGTVCVNTTQFTVQTLLTGSTGARTDVVNLDCPFTLDSLNNYLSFGSICFSTYSVGGGCRIRFDKVFLSYPTPWKILSIVYTPGDRITGVRKASGGIFDPSELYTGVCTDYTIYGIAGRGVINPLNTTIIAGLYYTSSSGQLLGFKNATTGDIYSVRPCELSSQAAVYQNRIVGVMTASANESFGFENVTETPKFYYHSNGSTQCKNPVLTYGSVGVCPDGSLVVVETRSGSATPVSPIVTGNITVPSNFTVSVQVEYLQMYMQPVSVDCNMYVCGGNPHCLRLLSQYASACRTIEESLQLSARLESVEVANTISVSSEALQLANVTNFDAYNVSVLLPRANGKSVIEDLLFEKVVTSGLGTVDQDYKQCIKDRGVGDVADVACAQYYNGIMVLPGVVDDVKMALYTASLTGGMVLAGITAGASIPFSLAVQSRLNYVALQTDVLNRNQEILAQSFNSALSNITEAFSEVNHALQETSDAINTVAQALGKVQTVVNEQGQALSQLTRQLSSNFQAISNSIEDIYNRLDGLAADAQVDRLITGRIGALNAFVSQTLTKYTEVRSSRQLAIQKLNECVKSQSARFGFCGNGTHLFSIANAAPNGIMLFHTVLLPSEYVTVQAWAGICIDDSVGLILRDFKTTLFRTDDYYITSRDMFEPRKPVQADFIRIANCSVTYLNISSSELGDVIPDYIDVNKTLENLEQNRPNFTLPELEIERFNNTYLNLSGEIAILQQKSESLYNSTVKLQELIERINNSYVDLELLNRIESYVKWPWYVWLAIILVMILFSFLMLYCCCMTGCCGCCSCLANSCLDCRGKRLQQYEVEKVHIQ
uniref:Spike glycoprotein n=2 Tax=unclassified Orthocoronavirinae TaxID=2730119 RepID=A0AA49I9M5_9NIDO|nr:spike glycoprotein [Bat Coronavirus RfZJ20]WCC63006.1 spike glycoprotein [Bat Coronavirus RpGX17]WCC63012.1 spike glycoprotein [Bat Coronavirus RpGX17]